MTNVRHKRYLVFGGIDVGGQRLGGWEDFIMATDDPEAAIKRAKAVAEEAYGWAHVIDTEVALPVWQGEFSKPPSADTK